MQSSQPPPKFHFKADLSAMIMTMEREQAFEEITSRGIPFDIPAWRPQLSRVVMATRILGACLGVSVCAS